MLYWFDHVGLLLCQFFYHIYKCSLNFFSNIKHWICELIFSWPLVPLGAKPFLNHKGSTCHVLKCIPSCKLPDNPANVNKKVICSKCWITHRNGRAAGQKELEKGGHWGSFGVPCSRNKSIVFAMSTTGKNEIQTLLLPSIKVQSPGELVWLSMRRSTAYSLFLGKESAWFAALHRSHTTRERWAPQQGKLGYCNS